MKCKKCRKEAPDGLYCIYCGAKQDAAHKPKNRGNGQGSVYQRPNKTWVAIITVGYEIDKDGRLHRKTRSKSGFRTKKEAVAYLPQLSMLPKKQKNITFLTLYNTWEPTHKASRSTMGCYHSALQHFRAVWHTKLDDIDIDDLQDCIDNCGQGKRTKQNMKSLCGLLYKYAIPRNLAALNMGQYLVVGGGKTNARDGLPIPALEILASQIGRIEYADYIVAQCYLGFRPSELLDLDAKNYDRKTRAFVGGAKTEAGKNRTVPVSPKIQPIIDRLLRDRISGPVFCNDRGERMTIKEYRSAFYSALDTAGIENPIEEIDGVKRRKYTPHSCRHTFATLLKTVNAPDKDKLKLIGHTSNEMLQYYQDVNIDDLRRIIDAI